jgi:hypothetical protein
MVHGQLSEGKSAAMRTGHELPPKAFLHISQFPCQPLGDSLGKQHIGTAGIMHGRPEDGLIEQIKES